MKMQHHKMAQGELGSPAHEGPLSGLKVLELTDLDLLALDSAR